jgi:hypothetical protein
LMRAPHTVPTGKGRMCMIGGTAALLHGVEEQPNKKGLLKAAVTKRDALAEISSSSTYSLPQKGNRPY